MFLSLKKVVTSVLFASLLAINVSFGSYKISGGGQVYNSTVEPSSNEGKYKVEFKSSVSDSKAIKTLYVDSDYNLSLKDAPFVFENDNVYEWISSDSKINLATIEEKDGSYISSDITFVATEVSSIEQFSSNYSSSIVLNISDSQDKSLILGSSDYVYLNGAAYSGTTNALVQIPKGSRETSGIGYDQKVCFDNNSQYGQINTFFTHSNNLGEDTLNGSFISYNSDNKRYEFVSSDTYNYNADCTIALADTEGKLTDYKPFSGCTKIGGTDEIVSAFQKGFLGIGGSYKNARIRNTTNASATALDYSSFAATNYVVKKFVLERDVILNNVTFNLGAHNGFYGQSINWSQNNYNNFIVGAYTEIDLNGHDLILANNSVLNAYGSITDSSNDLGSIIVESGSKVQGLLTLEDCAHETDVFSYYFNIGLLRMFRMPYLDCTIDIKYGGMLDGLIMKDTGGQSNMGFSATISLIGTSDNCLIKMTNEKGHIIRSVHYDDNIRYSNIEKKTERANIIRNNLYYQRIRYDVYDAEIEWNYFQANFSMSIYSLNVDSRDWQFFIPSYFEICLHSSSVRLSSELVFMPGSYLNVDKQSSIDFTFDRHETERKNKDGFSSRNITLYRSGGLIFAQHLWPLSNSGIESKLETSDATSPVVFGNNSAFWDYLNSFRPAKCDLYGTISFNEDIDSSYPGYTLSGMINDYNNSESIKNYLLLDQSKANQNQPGVLTCFGRASGPLNTINGTGSFIVMSYMNSPIVSNGRAFSNDIDDTNSTYDSNTGIVTTSDRRKFALILDNASFLNSWFQDDQLQLNGSYRLVDYDASTNSIRYNNQTYIYFQGIFLKATSIDSSNATKITANGVNLDCMIGGSSSRPTAAGETTNCSLVLSNNRWTLNTVA